MPVYGMHPKQAFRSGCDSPSYHPMAETAITDPRFQRDAVINIDLRQMNKSLFFSIRMRNSSAL